MRWSPAGRGCDRASTSHQLVRPWGQRMHAPRCSCRDSPSNLSRDGHTGQTAACQVMCVHAHADTIAYLAGHTGDGVRKYLKTHVLPSCHWGAVDPDSAPVGWSLLKVQHNGALINLRARGGGREPRLSCGLAIVAAADAAAAVRQHHYGSNTTAATLQQQCREYRKSTSKLPTAHHIPSAFHSTRWCHHKHTHTPAQTAQCRVRLDCP